MMSRDLVDSHGRRIRKLRVSLLDACNFRCFYCMPMDAEFMPSSRWLSSQQIESVCRTLIPYGIEEIRITGGEPTMRREFRDIVSRLSQLSVRKLGLTSNGWLLGKHLEFLKDTNCQNINISLDSIREERFNRITRTQAFDVVYRNIVQAREMEFSLKINVVLMRGVNDDEILDFVKFSRDTGIEVRFLEVMRIGQACGSQTDLFMAANDCLQIIKEQYDLEKQTMEGDSTSFNYVTKCGAKIGFIASESQPFCGGCSRWRLSADGFLRACLMSEKGVDIKNVPYEDYPQFFGEMLALKPTGRIKEVDQDMNQIGG